MSQHNAQDRAAAAAEFAAATYLRMEPTDTDGHPLYVVEWTGAGSKPKFTLLEGFDKNAFGRRVAAHAGGTYYIGVRPRRTVPADPSSTGRIADLPQQTQSFLLDIDTQVGGKPDGSGGATPYPPDHDTARRLITATMAQLGLPVHALVRTPAGYHVWVLTEPLDVEAGDAAAAGLEAAVLSGFHAAGYTLDRGVTTTPTRMGRAPGSLHQKYIATADTQTPPVLVTLEATSDAPLVTAAHLRAVLPTVLPARTAALPVVDAALTDARSQYQLRFPVEDALEALGWKRNSLRTDSWTSPLAEATSLDAAHIVVAADSHRYAHIWSESARTTYGSRMSSADAVAYAVGSYGDARALWARALADETGAAYSQILAALLDQPALQALARRADTGWPDSLSRAHQEYLMVRGVAPDVATARGYQTVPQLPASLQKAAANVQVEEALLVPARTLAGVTVETARVWGNLLDKAGNPVGEALVGVGQPVRGLCVHPSALDQVQAPVPLIVVTQDDPTADPSPSLAQTSADAVWTAAQREGLEVAVVHASTWASVITPPGAPGNPTHTAVLEASWSRVPLRSRTVYLASRCTWREDKGLTQVIEALSAAGAIVHVLDVPRPDPVSAAVIVTDTSTRTVGDWVAAHAGSDPLRRLLRDAIPATAAVEQCRVPDAKASAEMAATVAAELARTRAALYVRDSRRWVVDRGTHMEALNASTPPVRLVTQILWEHGVHVTSTRTLREVISGVEADDRVQVQQADMDADPYMLPTLTGLVDLRTGALQPRPTGYLNEKIAPVAYDPTATSPAYTQFVEQVSAGHQGLPAFLQRLAGLVLIGAVVEEVMTFWDGPGRNGKSTLLNLWASVLGPYAASTPVEVLANKPSPFQRGFFQGVRLLMAPEPPRGMRMQDAALKALVSRDPANGEVKFGSPFTYTPSHTLISTVNHVPLIRDRSEGSKRRFLVVPFDLRLTDEQADRGLEARLKGQAPAILAWMVQGAVQVVQRIHASEQGFRLPGGLLDPPPAVVEHTTRYWEQGDLVAQWLAQYADLTDTKAITRTAEVHAAFADFLQDEGESRWSAQRIAEELATRGIRSSRRGSLGRVYVGLRIRSADELVDEMDTLAPVVPLPTASIPLPLARVSGDGVEVL